MYPEQYINGSDVQTKSEERVSIVPDAVNGRSGAGACRVEDV